MLHIHFGCGRLGLGLAAPFLKTAQSELYLLNRHGRPGEPGTGMSRLPDSCSNTRNALLADPHKTYYLQSHTEQRSVPDRISYDGFFSYADEDTETCDTGNVETAMAQVLEASRHKRRGVLVTAALGSVAHYSGVMRALQTLCDADGSDGSGAAAGHKVYFIACENLFGADAVMAHDAFAPLLSTAARECIECVDTLVDRICSRLDRCSYNQHDSLLVHTEEYGKLTLAGTPARMHEENTLASLLEGSRANFSKHLKAERDIKSWLLNGSHWLISLTAFRETGGNPDTKLNDFITGSASNRCYAAEIITEMRQGVEALLRSDPSYASFLHDTDIVAYLDEASSSILSRFTNNDDSLARILRRFRAPSIDNVDAIGIFVSALLQKVERPLHAYSHKYGSPPRASTEALLNTLRLQASAIYPEA